MSTPTPLGPLMLDIAGTQLTDEDRRLLRDPAVGGLILFTRNFTDLDQLRQLVAQMRSERPNLLISVDHEGGRVQRFRTSFTRIPAMGRLGQLWMNDAEAARRLAYSCGWLLASELLAVGIDFSFAPVLDREHGRSRVIGDRAFSSQSAAIVELSERLIEGMNAAGMAATGKHFPGHGYPVADSHVDIPRDERSQAQIRQDDMAIFVELIQRNRLAAVMPAHVIYEQVDARPAGFSRYWLQEVLRGELGFDGVIFSDDLSMEGAGVAGGYAERAAAALDAGCDMALVCNDRPGALAVLEALHQQPRPVNERLVRMQGKPQYDWESLHRSDDWQRHRAALERFEATNPVS